MTAIKSLGITTLKLEAELEQSWEIVRKSKAEADGTDESPQKNQRSKDEVTQENVSAFMAAIEMKVAELLVETGNDSMPQNLAMDADKAPEIDFTKMP